MPPIVDLIAALALLPLFPEVLGQESNLRGATELAQTARVLVFDAGSSGTRIHVFDFLPGEAGALVPKMDLAVSHRQTKKIKPGLSHFAEKSDLDGCRKSIGELIEFANQIVPETQRSSVPALLKATAGLRAVKPPEKATAILDVVRDTLSKSGYLFKPEWADIIQGKEEAGLAWVAANYLQGSFNGHSSGANSLGVIEMGGGSTQVTFEVHRDELPRIAGTDHFTFKTLTGQEYFLYAHSYLGFGQDYAQAKCAHSMKEELEDDPCYPVGYVRQAMGDNTKIIKGTGDAQACQDMIKMHLFNHSAGTAPGRYPLELPVRGNMVATENFFYVRHGLRLPLDGDISAMKEAADKWCGTRITFSEAETARMRDGRTHPFKEKNCFALSYQAALMDALKASHRPGVKVQIARQINGADIDWAMGAALMHFINSGLGGAGENPVSLTMRIGLVILSLLGLLGVIRIFVAPRCLAFKQAQHAGSQIVATTIGARAAAKAKPAE